MWSPALWFDLPITQKDIFDFSRRGSFYRLFNLFAFTLYLFKFMSGLNSWIFDAFW